MKRIGTCITLFGLLVCWSLPAKSQFTETREITKRYKVTPETKIEISNKYGKIDINTWDKDSVVFQIFIRIEEKKLSKLEQTLRDIDFDFTGTDHFVIARTSIGKSKNPLEDEIQKFKETVLQTGSNIEINYSVWLPGKNILKVENKFGDIFIDDYFGDAEIILSNGNLKAHDFKGKVALNFSFADATVNQIGQGRIDASYSDIYLKQAGTLQVISKSTTWEILEIKNLNTDSRRDKFKIRMIDILDGKGSFSSFRIDELTDRLNVRAEYGDVEVQKIKNEFNNIFIETRSTDINLYFSPEACFGFDITYTKTELSLCRELKTHETKILDEKDKKTRLSGTYGKKTTTKEKLYINSFAGEINILTE